MATDACDSNPTITVVRTEVAGACAGSTTVTRLFTATDACGNTATASQVVTVVDTEAPTFVGVPADVSLTCGDAEPTSVPTAVDACSGTSAVRVATQRIDGASVNAYVLIRTFSATDACGNEATARQRISFSDASVPEWSFVPQRLDLDCGASVPTVLAKAVDGCDGELTVTYMDLSTAGSCAGNVTVKRTFMASDADGNVITAEQLIAYTDKVAPVFGQVPADVTIACGEAVPTTVPIASDACSGTVRVTEVSSSAAGRCAGETIVTRIFTALDDCGNAATAKQIVTLRDLVAPVFEPIAAVVVLDCGQTAAEAVPRAVDACGSATVTYVDRTGPRECASSGEITRTWTATDACGNSATVSQVIRRVDRSAPVWTDVPADLTVECAAEVPIVLAKAEDLCSNVSAVTYSDTKVAGSCAGSYDLVRTFTVSDDCGNTTQTKQTIRIRDRVAPVMSNVPTEVSISCDQPLPKQLPTAVDACQGAISIVESSETIPGSCADSYVHVRVFTATDACGNRATARQHVNRYDNQKPVFATTLSDIELSCGQAVPKANVTATDNCDREVSITYSEQFDGASTACTGRGALVRVWTATDNCGNVATMRQRVLTVDRSAPVMVNLPRSVTINCGSPIAGGRPTATDNCDNDVKVYHKDKEVAQNCGRTIQRTWYAEDKCGNVTTGLQSILLVDKDDPVFTTVVTEQITLGCGEDFPAVKLAAKDACDTDLTYDEASLDLGPGTCPGEKLVMRIFTATDDCGNQAVLTQQVTIVDRTPPTLTGVPASMDVACLDYDYKLTQPLANDACSDKVTLKETSKPTQVNRDGKVIDAVIRTWTATDGCGNSSTASQVLVLSGAAARITTTTTAGSVGQSVCAGDQVTLTAPAGGSAYTWSNGAKGQTIKVTADATREYSVSFGGSCAGQAKVMITVAPRPAFRLAAVPALCEGQTLSLSVSTEATGVRWTGPLGFKAEGSSVELEDMALMQSGYYYASATAVSGCALRDSVYVTVGTGACAEICGNGIDDDGDGLIDCEDPDCGCCVLTAALLTTECRDNGTPNNPTDDMYAVYVNLKGDHLAGKAFIVSGDAKLGAIYAGQPVLLGVYPIAKASASFSFESATDATCSLRAQTVSTPGSCTDACDVTIVSTVAGDCRDGQYDLAVTVRYTNPRGALLVNGKRFKVSGTYGEATLTLPRLSCTGTVGEALRISFEGDSTCGAAGAFDAACPDDACLPILVELGARP